MSGTGLSRFGAVPPTMLREPATDSDGLVICSECGRPVGGSRGPQRLRGVEPIGNVAVDALVTFGYRCERHHYPLVLPRVCGESGARMDGWVAVRFRFADGVVRHVPVPAREVSRRE